MFAEIFNSKKPVIGMVHLKALPGSPGCKDSWEEIPVSYTHLAAFEKVYEESIFTSVANLIGIPACLLYTSLHLNYIVVHRLVKLVSQIRI